jgi:hypothetical protein
MADMRLIPDQVSTSTKSPAERQLFARLRRVEDSNWYWGLHSLNLPEHVWKRMSEIDFVVAGPRGIYALEVKGGNVACHNGVWTFTDRYGEARRKHESPFAQASSAMFTLEKLLREKAPAVDLSRVTFGYAVVLPDCNLNVEGVEWAPEMVFDRRQLDRSDGLRRSLSRLVRYWQAKPGGRSGLLGEHEAKLLLQALRPTFDAVPTLRQITADAEAELVSLTTGQYRALDAHARNPRILFEGGAGTGKTLLAAEISRRKAAEGLTVLFTCRSEVLAGFVAHQPGIDSVDVTPFERLRHMDVVPYDVVVADEAQDLINADDLPLLDSVTAGGLRDGTWLMFMDSNNQRGLIGSFDRDALDLILDIRPALVTLNDNCRNTRNIVTKTQELTGADVGVSTAGAGPQVKIVRAQGAAQGAVLAAAHLDQLDGEGVDPSDIVLLSPQPLPGSVFADLPPKWRQRIETLDLYQMRRPAHSRIGFARTGQFKGLESRFVLLDHLAGPGTDTERSNLYVGMTRARVGLWVVTDESFSELTPDQRREATSGNDRD